MRHPLSYQGSIVIEIPVTVVLIVIRKPVRIWFSFLLGCSRSRPARRDTGALFFLGVSSMMGQKALRKETTRLISCYEKTSWRIE